MVPLHDPVSLFTASVVIPKLREAAIERDTLHKPEKERIWTEDELAEAAHAQPVDVWFNALHEADNAAVIKLPRHPNAHQQGYARATQHPPRGFFDWYMPTTLRCNLSQTHLQLDMSVPLNWSTEFAMDRLCY